MAKNIEVTLTLNDKGFSRKASNAQRQIGALGTKSKATTGAIAGLAARFAVIAAPIVALTAGFKGLSSALNISAEFEKTQVTLSNIIGSAEGGQAAFNALREVALELPIAFNELASAAPALATVSKDIKTLEENTRLAADIAANFGIPFETAAGQLQRSFSAGAGAADVFREKGVLAAAGFEAGVSYSVEETQKKIAEFGASIEGASAKLNQTFAGSLNQTGDALELFGDAIGSVILPEAQAFLNGLVESFRKNKTEVLAFATAIGQNVVKGIKAFAMGIATAIDIGLSMAQTMKRIAQAIRTNFGDQIRVVANAVVKAFGGMVEGISLVGKGIGKLISATTGVTDVEDFFDNINEAAKKVRQEGLTAIEEVGDGMANFIPVTTARDTVGEFITIVDEGAEAIREKKKAVDEAAQSIGGDLPIALAAASAGIQKLTEDQEDLVKELDGKVRASAITELRTLFEQSKISASEFKELLGDLSDFMKIELMLAKEALAKGTPLSDIFDDDSIASTGFKTALNELQDAIEGTTLTSEEYATIQDLVKASVDDLGLSLEQQLFLLKVLDQEFMNQEGLLSFLDTLGQAQKALSEDLATAFLEGQSAGEAFQGFFKKMITQILADILRLQIIQPLLSGLFGLSFGAGGSVTGMDFGSSFFGGIFGKAKGGPVMANQPYIVGEKGPELFVPGQSGGIVPNGGMGQQVTYNINAIDSQSFKSMIAKDPEFLFNVTQMGARRVPG